MPDPLDVPGARLFWRSQGDGPTLLLIGGGVYDADALQGIAEHLSDSFTVITYDRRGNSRSSHGVTREPQHIATHAEDARRILLAAGASEAHPAAVFGNSSGATIALELSAMHPELVHTIIAHEPPIFNLLDDRAQLFELLDRVEATFETEGTAPAMEVFSQGLSAANRGNPPDTGGRAPGGADLPPAELPPDVAEMMQRMDANLEFFIGFEAPYFSRYEPAMAQLRARGASVIPAAGESSAGEAPHRSAVALSEALNVELRIFPGDHGGFGSHPQEFASTLEAALLAADQTSPAIGRSRPVQVLY